MAITQDGKIAGCYGFHVLECDPGGERIGWALDIMVAPRFQGKGLFRPLAEYATTQVKGYQPVALCVVANERADGAHIHGLGWERVTVLTDFVYASSNPSREEEDRVGVIRVSNLTSDGMKVSPRQWRSRGDPPLFSVKRSAPFLRWRFLRNPWYNYDIFRCDFRGQSIGYLALKVFCDPKTSQTFGDIVDIFWEEDNPEALVPMLRFAMDHFHRRGVRNVTTWLQTNTILDQVGRGLGFVETKQKRYFCLKVIDDRYVWLRDPRLWFITMADSEVY
jgi:hypothetical protein